MACVQSPSGLSFPVLLHARATYGLGKDHLAELLAELGFVLVYDVAIAEDTYARVVDSDALMMAAGDGAVNTTFRLVSACMACSWYACNSIL